VSPSRSLKLAALQKALKPPPVHGGAPDEGGELLLVGWGGNQGAIEEAVDRLRAAQRARGTVHPSPYEGYADE
jgi:hypothetical protein